MTAPADLAELYILGALDDDAHAEVEARIAAPADAEDRALREAVRAARERFHDLDRSAPQLPVGAGLWSRIEAALTGRPQPVGDGARGAAGVARAWRPTALAAMAATVLLAAGLTWQVLQARPPLTMAILLNDDGQSVALVETYPDDTIRVTPLAPISPDGPQVLEVWTKPDPDGPPVSLGTLERARRARLTGPDLPLPDIDQLYEITVEPAGGSPTGQPTGPVVGLGNASRTY
ncbi:Anti-sigma-K factor RskA [Tranquillimonas rosea]|uniref:Anti-sigma-K factor RskA n=1 Tax=Tranquillimonas rosea TaxID=641238 RepID=A0A1H9WY56_9RHOB|nr:anti-sigma factor [Tranquillimonas rosea]SES38774.1 Anti-sigma-K factor RskA [Tranquillimonas rosea]